MELLNGVVDLVDCLVSCVLELGVLLVYEVIHLVFAVLYEVKHIMHGLVDPVCDGFLEVIYCLLEFVGNFFNHLLNMGPRPVSLFLDLVDKEVQSLK